MKQQITVVCKKENLKKSLNLSSLGLTGTKLVEISFTISDKSVLTLLWRQSWAWMTETCTLFHNALSVCALYQLYYLPRGGEITCLQSMSRCFQQMTDLNTMRARQATEYLKYRGSSKHDMQDMALCYDVWWCLIGFGDWTQSLDVNGSSYQRSQLDICVLCAQWLLKPSH